MIASSLVAVEHEDLLDLLDARLRAVVVVRTQVGHRAVQKLVDDALRHHINCLALLVTEVLKSFFLRLGELGLADDVVLLLQGRDRRHVAQGLLPLHEFCELNAEEQLGLEHLVPPLRLVGGDNLLEVVHVVGKHTGHLVAASLDVARHRDVDQHQRVARRVSAPDTLLELLLRNDAGGRGGRRESEVRHLHSGPELVHELDLDVNVRVASGELVGTLLGAVKQCHLRDAVRR
mmetsp:Transcript_15443/g.39827  ORF Transcript_15443/g.39827 Transcript_15443/m.39827 type:complete len:233 (+) Transcript_15443:260-958(+)